MYLSIAIYDGSSWETITSQNSVITSHVNEIVLDDDNTAYIGVIDGLFKNNDNISIVLDSFSLESNFINIRCLTLKVILCVLVQLLVVWDIYIMTLLVGITLIMV